MSARFVLFLLLVCAPSLAFAQSLEPRLYLPLPTGRNVVNTTYSHTSGTIVFDGMLPVENGHATLDALTLAYVRTFGLFGRSAQVQAISSLATGEASATVAGSDTTRTLDGPTDPMVRLAVNLSGGPARRRDELAGVTFGTIIGASLSVTMPFGDYDEERRVNLGANRWSVKPEVGVVQHALKAAFATGVTTRYGGDFDIISIGYQYGWGR